MVPASVNEKYVIRFCAVAQNANDEDIGNERSFIVATKGADVLKVSSL